MKALFHVVLIAIVLAATACHKDDATVFNLNGKWKLTEALNDPGDGSGKFRPVVQKTEYDFVQFNTNGTLNSSIFSDYVRYSVKDSTVTLYKSDNSLQHYSYKFHDGVLDMSPAGPLYCIEGCAQRFVKIGN